LYFAVIAAEFDGVGHQIGQYLLQALAVPAASRFVEVEKTTTALVRSCFAVAVEAAVALTTSCLRVVKATAALALNIQDIETRHLSQKNVQRLEKLRAKVDDILHGVRRFSHELRPEILDQLGLIPTLELLVSELNEEEKIKARFKVTEYQRRLLPETELALFRIAQEAISNIRKYSQAKRVLIELAFTQRKTKMKIGDNGIGFELPEEIGDLASLGKLGLIGMKERARIIDGDLTVKSSPNQGTTVAIELAE